MEAKTSFFNCSKTENVLFLHFLKTAGIQYISVKIDCEFLGARVRKVVCHPTENSLVLSSAQGNNEISIWNLETGFREKVLWGSKTPPLSKTNVS